MNAVVSSTLPVLAALVLMLLNGVVLAYMLRKVLGHMHLRHGPLHVGPKGVIQTVADVLKLLSKEDITPNAADRWMYALAPAVVFAPSLMAYAALPFSETLRITRLDTGLLFTFAVLSIAPLGIIMAGWASANKWSLLGAMRSVAQQVACGVPMLLSVLPVVMIAGTLDLGHIVLYQTGLWLGVVPKWFALPLLPSLAIFTIAALGELNQTPFDMVEAESELVAGFATEYSSARFGLLFISEFSNSFVLSALAVTVFFGGWTFPFVPQALLSPLAPVVFLIKTYIVILVLMWIRGALPSVRIDHLMDIAWKWLIPLSLVWIMLVGLVMKLSMTGSVG